MNDTIYVGKIGKTIGLKGQLKVYIESDFPEQFQAKASFTTNKGKTLTIETYDPNKNLVKFQHIDTVDEAKAIINQQLYTSMEKTRQTCALNEKEFFWFDIIRCNIVEASTLLGNVTDIHRYPSCDYLQIDTHPTLIDQNLPKTFLIPYTPLYIKHVSLQEKTIQTQECRLILENS